MAQICRLMLLLSFAVLLFGLTMSSADVGLRKLIHNPFEEWFRGPIEPDGGGMVATEVPSRTVRMEEAKVTIRLQEQVYIVDAVFNLINTGETETVSVLFPRLQWPNSNRKIGQFKSFDAWVDGHTAKFEEKSGFLFNAKSTVGGLFGYHRKEESLWLVCEVPFPAGKRRAINVVYKAGYAYPRNDAHVRYLVGTISSWKDKIGKAFLTVDGAKVGGTKNFRAILSKTLPPNRTTEKAVIFEIDDWKPEPHLKLDILVKHQDPEKRLELYGKPKPNASK